LQHRTKPESRLNVTGFLRKMRESSSSARKRPYGLSGIWLAAISHAPHTTRGIMRRDETIT
jgi:hypothetical protein